MIHGRKGKGFSRHIFYVLLGLFGIGMGAFGQGIPTTPAPRTVTPASATGASQFDQPLAWLLDARRNFTAVQDYTCTLTKQESINGVLSEPHIIDAKFRTKPFSVYMRWLAPSKLYNQEAAFVLGQNNNKMRVHSKGLIKGAVGFVSLDLNDRRVMEQSRHTIYDAGIGNLIEQAIKYVEVEKEIGKGHVRISQVLHDNRHCLRVEIIRSERRQQYDFHRTVFYLDKDAKLPVRAENYDWPRQGGSPTGDLIEQVSFTNLRWNLGLTEREFNK
jgi:Protein of unknown function (DUF1571)